MRFNRAVQDCGRRLIKAIFDSWQRSLFSRQQTAGKEPLLAGKHRRGCVFKGATSRFAHIEKFSPEFSNSSFVIRVNFSTLSHSCFYMFNYYLFGVFYLIGRVSFNLKLILEVASRSNSKYRD